MAETDVEYVSAEVASYVILVTLDDGCTFEMAAGDKQSEGWQLDFPAGFSVTCPHGFSDGLVPISGGFVYDEQVTE